MNKIKKKELGNWGCSNFYYFISYEVTAQKHIVNLNLYQHSYGYEPKKIKLFDNNEKPEFVKTIIDDLGRFTEFPGIYIDEDLKSTFPLPEYICDGNFVIDEFSGDRMDVTWYIPLKGKLVQYHSILSHNGRFEDPFSLESKMKTYPSEHYVEQFKDGQVVEKYADMNAQIKVGDIVYKGINHIKELNNVVYYTEDVPCFDSHDRAFPSYIEIYIICQNNADAEKVNKLVRENRRITSSFADMSKLMQLEEQEKYGVAPLYKIICSGKKGSLDLYYSYSLEKKSETDKKEIAIYPFMQSDERDFITHDNILVKYIGRQPYVNIPEGVIVIGEGAFENAKHIISVNIPQSVMVIKSFAFKQCGELENINLPKHLQVLEDSAFSHCYKLSGKITIPYGITEIHGGTFHFCYEITEVEFLGKVRRIHDSAFDSCSSLKISELPETVWRIGDYAFSSCNSITTFTMPEKVYPLGEKIFSSCKSLKKVTLPINIKEIPEETFLFCDNLENVVIPNSVESIKKDAFRYCKNLQSLTVPNSVTEIADEVFYGCSRLRELYLPKQILNNEEKVEKIIYNSGYKCEVKETRD